MRVVGEFEGGGHRPLMWWLIVSEKVRGLTSLVSAFLDPFTEDREGVFVSEVYLPHLFSPLRLSSGSLIAGLGRKKGGNHL